MSVIRHLAVAPLPEQYPYLDRLVPLFYQAWTSRLPEVKVTLLLVTTDQPNFEKVAGGSRGLHEVLIACPPFDNCPDLAVISLPTPNDDDLSSLRLLATVVAPCFAGKEGETVLLSDLNKLPLKAHYFTDPLRELTPDCQVITTYRDNFVNRRQALTSYHAASHQTWCDIFATSPDRDSTEMWLDLTSRFNAHLPRLDGVRLRGFFYTQIDGWEKQNSQHKWTRLNDRSTGFKRLEQDYILESIETLCLRGRYTDLAVNSKQYNTLGNLYPIAISRDARHSDSMPKEVEATKETAGLWKPKIKITPKFNLSSLYDRCYIINLKERTDRREHMLSEIQRFELPNVEFFDAVRPTIEQVAEWHPNFCSYMERRIGRKFPNYQIGALGCLLSHQQIMTQAIEAGYQRILILEDDTVFHRSLSELGGSLPEINNEYDMLYLSVNNMRPPTKVSPHFYRLRRGLTTSAYFITLPTMIEVVRKLSGYGKEIDTFYTEQIQPKYRCYVYKPYITGQIASQSDIMQRKVSYHLR